jgi:curved DNA-binding protein CbpA
MDNKENYYEILGINKNANDQDIIDAYRYKVNILHPDKLTGSSERIKSKAEDELRKVNQAYEVLSNPKKRQKYDKEMKQKVNSGINKDKHLYRTSNILSITSSILSIFYLTRLLRRQNKK